MAGLIAKKLSKQPIGTQVELTYGDGVSQKASGIISDNDFSDNVELTTYTGEELLLDYSIVRGLLVTKSLDAVLKELPSGAKIRFSYGSEDNREPCLTGVVLENDGEETLEIKTDLGQELLLNYSVIRSLLVESKSGTPSKAAPSPVPSPPIPPEPAVPPAPAPTSQRTVPLYERSPEDFLNASDKRLKDLFSALPKDDRKKLSGFYDSFKYGLKVNDRDKMSTAANAARQLLFQEESQGYPWSCEAVRFCGYLLRRANVYDPQVFLVGRCFYEAAFACWKIGEAIRSGAYATLALLGEGAAADGLDWDEDLTIMLAFGTVTGEDCSGLCLLWERRTPALEEGLKPVIRAALAAKGIQADAGQDAAQLISLLKPLYPSTGMDKEIRAWLSDCGDVPQPVSQSTPQPAETVKNEPQETPPAPSYLHGSVSRLNWAEQAGSIVSEEGAVFSFRYAAVVDGALLRSIKECVGAEPGKGLSPVKFVADGATATQIQPDDSPVDRARAIVAESTREDRFETAFALCKKAMETSDIRRALSDLVKYAITLYKSRQDASCVKEAISLYEKHITLYPNNAFSVMYVAQCYSYLKKYPQMLEHADKAADLPGLSVQQKIPLLGYYMRITKEYYDITGDKALLTRMLEKLDGLKTSYPDDFAYVRDVGKRHDLALLPYRVIAECGLDMLEAAERDYANVADHNHHKPYLDELMTQTRARLASREEPDPPISEVPPEETPAEDYTDPIPDGFEDTPVEEEPEAEILPYQDADGWAALSLTKKDVVDYAIGIRGEGRLPAMVAYLRAGATLNPELAPIYRSVALAVNDPMEEPDYSIAALTEALSGCDGDYPVLNDCCLGAAFLRASFISGMGYDYSAMGLRDSIAICQQLPALRTAYDTMEEFRKEAGRAIDIYADYRNHGSKALTEALDAAVRRGEELYGKFILTPAREGAKFARLLETKKIVFARDGYLATMLNYVATRDQEALEQEKEHFASFYLNGAAQFSSKHISVQAVDELIVESWELAGKNMRMKKANSTLQGDRRNNLRSNISEILDTICQWYMLSEQSAGQTWKTEQGESAYLRLRPQLMEQLHQIDMDCARQMETCTDDQLSAGLFLLSTTAGELSARLDGSWKFEQEKYMYIDFLRGNSIMLNDDLLPELASTFCVLPHFNVLARIRQHVEGPKRSFQEQIHQIFGMDKTCNNYGSARQIVRYLEATGSSESVTLPDKAEQYIEHTQMQIDMRFRSFRETYALAINYGQIIHSDTFCDTLEDTVRYWYAFCRNTQNYGFFTSILLHAENQIHASAQQYEEQLDAQLDALIASNQAYFDNNPDYAEAIRAQVANQNFTVAEDWMARIRIGDFSLDVQRPEALGYLEDFWNNYVLTYNRVADASRALNSLLGRREVRNKDSKHAQHLMDSWLHNGNPSNSARIGQLLNLLGWQNIAVQPYQFPGDSRAELYEVRKERRSAGLTTPQHPIAAYGSGLEQKPMYVICLYGSYDCDRLYEKMRTVDAIDGNKVILLDYALGQADRRALARKLKQRESGLRNVYLVIDRVLITHLANNYNENLINRILMAIAMPFSYCQPYVVESVHTMPPEIFIGRKDELLKIEQADGVNLIYGGRQLGKSALFKKALADLDGRQQQRAVLIDIKELDCPSAARKISTKLIDLNITPDAQPTEDWDTLCRNIERRLRSEENEIVYFLLMLDEADAFISDCGNCGYRPLVALKDVQQSLPGRFKYVLAGLHNIVKFNRQVALGNNSVITHMPSLKITPFRTPEAQELLTLPLSYLGFSLPSKVTVSQILATCNYFPGLIQLYAKKLIESVRAADYAGYDIKKTPPYVVSDEHLRRVMSDKEFIEQIHEKFEITLTLDQDQGSRYYPLTLLIGWMYNDAPSKNGYTAKDVLYHARDLSVHPLAELDEEKIDALLQELQDLNILRSVSNESYLLASKNFRDLLGSDEEILEKLVKVGGSAL